MNLTVPSPSRPNKRWAAGPLAATLGVHPRPLDAAAGPPPAPGKFTRADDVPAPPSDPHRLARFEATILPHLDAAYNLARWLCGNEPGARDVVQDACLRAFRAFDGFHGTDGRPWLLTTVRHTAYTWLRKNRPLTLLANFEEDLHDTPETAPDPDPAARLLQDEEAGRIQQAIATLPVEFREVILLRHQEELSYKQIAAITDLPPGTVMSRLARARAKLRESLTRTSG